MKKYISYLYTLALSQTARSTYITTCGAGLNAFLGFVFWIIVARSVSPADFGLFSVVINLVSILFILCDVGFSSSVIRFLPQAIRDNKKEEVKKIVKLSFLVVLALSGLLAFFLAFFSSPLASTFFAKKELSLPLAIASVSLIGLSLSYLFVSILQGQQKFLFGVITESSILLTKVLATIILFWLGRLNLVSVLIIFSLTSFTGFIIALFFVRPTFLLSKTDFSLAKILFGFGAWVALARIANAISSKIDTLMLVRFVEAAEVGFYAAAQKMTFVFPVLVTGVSVVLQPKFASLKTTSETKSFIKKSILLVSSLFVPAIVLFIIAPYITVWIYGAVYKPAILIFRYLLVSSSFFIATTVPMITILYYLGQPKFFATISILQLLLIFLANLFLIPKFGVIGPALSLAIAYAVIFVVSSLFVYQKLKEK